MSKVKSSCLPAMSPFLIKFSFSKHFEAWHYPNTLMEHHGKPTPTENQLVPRSLGSSQHPHPRVRRTGQHNRSRHRPSTGSPWECSFLATATASGIALGDIAWEYTTILRGMNMDEYSVNHLEMGRNKCSHDIMSILKIHLGMDTGDDIVQFILVALSEDIGETQKSKNPTVWKKIPFLHKPSTCTLVFTWNIAPHLR